MDSHYQRQPQDTVTVHHQVIRAIITAAVASIPGIVRIGYAGGGFDRWLRFDLTYDGIQLKVSDDELTVDVSLVVDMQHPMYDISQAAQHEISRRLEEYVGMNVKTVNIHIEDVIWASEGES